MSEQPHACPVCGRDEDSRRAVRRHLLVGHRKSAITDVLLETTRPAPDLEPLAR